ncbi:hypothetical protein [Clostridium isatidis]|nr:hypothetical protein [Clostridium isatidis]NLZ34120.1 hypothetical protein [Clostridiales bacterium]
MNLILDLLKDKKILIGIGIGMIFTSLLMFGFGNRELSDSEIEERARKMGMHFEDECKVLFEGNENND